MTPTTLLDTPPVLEWLRLLGVQGSAHGADLADLMAHDPGPWTPERDAGSVLYELACQGKIRKKGRKPKPTPQQLWGGAGGSFGVRGQGAHEVCWVWEPA